MSAISSEPNAVRERIRRKYEAKVVPHPAAAWSDDEPPLSDADAPEPDTTLPAAAPRCLRLSRQVSALADELFAFSKLPRLSWGFEELDRLAPFLVGGLVVVIGATGRGKSSFLLQVGQHHARTLGPVLIVSAELPGALVGGRMVARIERVPWSQALGGEVDPERVRRALDIPNMRIIDTIGADILDVIDAELVAFAEEYPSQPALVLVDYLQLLPGASQEMRHRVSDNIVGLRKLMVKQQAGAMVIAKAGRNPARALRSGEAMGTDATEAGAETGAIEHEALALVALGAMRPVDAADPDGASVVDLSIAKSRFGIADKVVPLRFEGATGHFEPYGAAVSAEDRRAEAKAKSSDAKIETIARSIRDLVSNSDKPLSRAEIADMTTGGNTSIAAAIKRLELASPPELVEVVGNGARRKGGASPLWTPDRARVAGLTIVPKAVGGHE